MKDGLVSVDVRSSGLDAVQSLGLRVGDRFVAVLAES